MFLLSTALRLTSENGWRGKHAAPCLNTTRDAQPMCRFILFKGTEQRKTRRIPGLFNFEFRPALNSYVGPIPLHVCKYVCFGRRGAQTC